MPADENEAPATAPNTENDSRPPDPAVTLNSAGASSSSKSKVDSELERMVETQAIRYIENHPLAFPSSNTMLTDDAVMKAPDYGNEALPAYHAQVPSSTIPPPNRQRILQVYKAGSWESGPRYNGHTITSKRGIKAGKDVMTYLRQEILRYAPGQTLTLYPRFPGDPHGLPVFPGLPPKEATFPEGELRNFESKKSFAPGELAQVEVLELLKGGTELGVQLLFCKVLEPPPHTQPEGPRSNYKSFNGGLKVVLKVFDPIFFPRAEKWDVRHRDMSKDRWADELLSREANALWHLYNKGLTGHPHPAPQYHGSWAIKFNVGHPSNDRWRCVGAILMEYIEGISMDKLRQPNIVHDSDDSDDASSSMSMDSDSDLRSMRMTAENVLSFPSSRDSNPGASFGDSSLRLKVFRKLLDGCVSFLHAGIDRNTFLARDMFFTLRNTGFGLEEPRVVFLDYTFCVVWSDTKESKSGRADEYDSLLPKVPSEYLLKKHPLERLPRPPHPAWKYRLSYFNQFSGWFPPIWMHCKKGCKGCKEGNSDLCKAPFRDWLEKEFGKDDEKYSRYSTLVSVMEQAAEDAKRRYLEDNPGIKEADLEKGDFNLLRDKERVVRRLQEEALDKEVMDNFLKAKSYFEEQDRKKQGQQEEADKENSRVNRPNDADKKSLRRRFSSFLGRNDPETKDKQGKDGVHGGDDGGEEVINVPKTRQKTAPNDGGHGGGEAGKRHKTPLAYRAKNAWRAFKEVPNPPDQD
ncbi:hypothetical protein LZ32DRAFT_651997 [Colletotrichum eremochloae]|nr:hypothetical protein LZ32DRAFT_651997 [Colletotrichum eremochloae]